MALANPWPAAASVPVRTPVLLGVFYGRQGHAVDDLRALGGWLGRHPAVVLVFTGWEQDPGLLDQLFDVQLTAIWEHGSVPMVAWEPSHAREGNKVEAAIAAGRHDAFVREWARRMKGFLAGPDGIFGNGDDRRAYLRPASEMNGDWHPWSAALGGDLPGDYVAMWRRLRGIFRAEGIDGSRLQWVWCVNARDRGGYPAEAYFPGEEHVDWLAVAGYNWGRTRRWARWEEPQEIYGPMLGRLRRLSQKPIAAAELATTSRAGGGPDLEAKSRWIHETFDYLAAEGVRMVVWFNQDKETDWSVFGGKRGDEVFRLGRKRYRGIAAYRAVVAASWILTADASSPRLLDDDVFEGTNP